MGLRIAVLVAGVVAAVINGVGCEQEDVEYLGEREFVSESIVGASLIPGTRVSLWFRDGGELSAAAGCNGMSGGYHLADGELVAGPLSMTEKGCSIPGGNPHDQDDWLAEFLMSRPSYTLEEPRLVLDDGSVRLTLLDREVAEPDRSLQGRVWTVTGLVRDGLVLVGAIGAGASLRRFPVLRETAPIYVRREPEAERDTYAREDQPSPGSLPCVGEG